MDNVVNLVQKPEVENTWRRHWKFLMFWGVVIVLSMGGSIWGAVDMRNDRDEAFSVAVNDCIIIQQQSKSYCEALVRNPWMK